MVKIDFECFIKDRIWFGWGWLGKYSGWRRMYLQPYMYWCVIDCRTIE